VKKSSVLWCHAILYMVTNIAEEWITSIFMVEDGGDMFLQNFGNHLQDNMMSQPWRPQLTKSLHDYKTWERDKRNVHYNIIYGQENVLPR
jgi:hypothetical protein